VSPFGLAVDAGHIYWADPGDGTIGRADLDGSNADRSLINGAGAPYFYELAVDADHIYWTNHSTGTIGRADLDGSNADETFISGGAETPYGLAVDR